jgi:hypothetical protein
MYGRLISLLLALSLLTACARVGSEQWCRDMQETPKTDWTINEGSDYTRYCLFKY